MNLKIKKMIMALFILIAVLILYRTYHNMQQNSKCAEFCEDLQHIYIPFVFKNDICICRSDDGYFGTDL